MATPMKRRGKSYSHEAHHDETHLLVHHLRHHLQRERNIKASRTENPFMERLVFAAIVCALPYLFLRTVGLQGPMLLAEDIAGWLIWSVFALEAVVLVATVRRRSNIFEVLLALGTVPIWPAHVVQVLQVLWLLRLFGVLEAVPLVGRFLAVSIFRFTAMVAFMAIVGGGIAFSLVEHAQAINGLDGIYWACTTISTVGYGDITAHTAIGKLFSMGVELMGPVLLGLVATSVSALVLHHVDKERQMIRSRIEGEVEHVEEEIGEVKDKVDEIEGELHDVEEKLSDGEAVILEELQRLHRRLNAAGIPDVPTEGETDAPSAPPAK